MGAAKRFGKNVMEGFFSRRRRRKMHQPKQGAAFEVNLVTSWNRQCGIATYTQYLAAELAKTCKVTVTPLPDKNPAGAFYKLLGYNAAHHGDVVHVQFEYGIFPPLKLGRRSLSGFAALPFYVGLALGNRKIVTTMHEPRKTSTQGGGNARLYTRLLDKVIYTTSDMVIVHTKESRQLLESTYHVEPEKIRVVPHGSYEQPVFQDRDAAKAKLGLQGKTVVTILGFVTAKKGHDLAIPLLGKLPENVHLLVAGGPQNSADEQYMQNLKVLASQYGVSDRVTFTGYLESLTDVLNASDIALLPYRYVTDSGVLHLLTAYRVPTLASDLAAFSEVHDTYGCIDLFKAGESGDLLEKLQILLSDTQHRSALKARCADIWNATRWSNIANRHLGLYRELLKN
jgi:glycosyltransferase involved in cell wall biosynthesis